MSTTRNKLLLAALTATLLTLAGCASGNIDDPGSAPVELEVLITDSPPIKAQLQGAVCDLTITEWTASFGNLPKNDLATTSPFNDIIIESITISYNFPVGAGAPPVDPANVPPPRQIGSPGAVPPNSQVTVNFDPILFQDITGDMLGQSAQLILTIQARTPVNDRITEVVAEVLNIEGC